MTVSFWGITENNTYIAGTSEPETGCLCSQLDPTWEMYLEGSDRESLARSADPSCFQCNGTGVEAGYTPSYEVNFSNHNARVILSLLRLCAPPSKVPLGEVRSQQGFCAQDNDLEGSKSVSEMRQQIMVARATMENYIMNLVSEEEVVHGAPRTDENGVVELRPVRIHSRGLSADDIRDKFHRFVDFVEEAARRGAVEIRWG